MRRACPAPPSSSETTAPAGHASQAGQASTGASSLPSAPRVAGGSFPEATSAGTPRPAATGAAGAGSGRELSPLLFGPGGRYRRPFTPAPLVSAGEWCLMGAVAALFLLLLVIGILAP
jgi:hypothetical protein